MIAIEIATRNFSKQTIKSLSAKGIRVIGSQASPAFDGDVYFSGVSFNLDDNGTHIVRTHTEVLALAN